MYEVFVTQTGATIAFVAGAAAALAMAERLGGDYNRAPAAFYVVNMSGRSVASFTTRDRAESAAMMRNMGSDCDSFRVAT